VAAAKGRRKRSARKRGRRPGPRPPHPITDPRGKGYKPPAVRGRTVAPGNPMASMWGRNLMFGRDSLTGKAKSFRYRGNDYRRKSSTRTYQKFRVQKGGPKGAAGPWPGWTRKPTGTGSRRGIKPRRKSRRDRRGRFR
jgi:hypothetical protein